MKPAERVLVIQRIAERLGAEDDWSYVDLVLEQFGFGTQYSWDGSKRDYVISCIKNGSGEEIGELDRFLAGHVRPDEEPWDESSFRVFITHLAARKDIAHALKSNLRYYGADGFVAHADIDPGKEWQLVIESALHSCHALVGLLHEGWRESNWCDQEVGIAIGRGVPVVPIQFDMYPYGFFGSVQAITNAGVQEIPAVARNLATLLLQDKRTADRFTESMVERLASAESFMQANNLSKMLSEHAPLLTRDQVERLRVAEKRNGELQGAFYFDDNLRAMEARIEATDAPSPPAYDLDEEPF